MSRSLSATAKQAIFAQETSQDFIILLQISHAALPTPIRVNNSGQDVTSNSVVYAAAPFALVLPDDDEAASPRMKLRIDNIDRTVVQALRSIASPPDIAVKIVRAAAPDTVEAQFSDFKLTGATYDAFIVEGEITVEDFTQEPFPADVFSPATFPGLF